jgi:hypothetical protein
MTAGSSSEAGSLQGEGAGACRQRSVEKPTHEAGGSAYCLARGEGGGRVPRSIAYSGL